jgi:hypothetical protein
MCGIFVVNRKESCRLDIQSKWIVHVPPEYELLSKAFLDFLIMV